MKRFAPPNEYGREVLKTDGGQCFLEFYAETPEDVRAAKRAELESVRTRKRRTIPENERHVRAAIAWDKRALETLELEDGFAPSSARKYVVRIYYRSAGDELLCFDVHRMTSQGATALAAEYAARQVYVAPSGKRRRKDEPFYVDAPDSLPSAEMFLADEIGADAEAQGRTRQPVHGARLVILPSQQRVTK